MKSKILLLVVCAAVSLGASYGVAKISKEPTRRSSVVFREVNGSEVQQLASAPKFSLVRQETEAEPKPESGVVPAQSKRATVQPPAGRLAVVADGNSPDPDDIGATAVMFGLFNATNLQDRLVHLSHSCDLKPAERISAADELRRQKVLDQVCKEGVEQFGPFNNLSDYFNCRTQQQAAVENLRDAINDSKKDDPLWIIEAGEPDIIGFALKAADPLKRTFVHVVSHHPANDNAGDFFTWQQVLDFGVQEHQIGDQNVGLKTKIDPWDWLKSHPDNRMRWIRKQFVYAEQDGVVKFQTGRFDCSDAGMVYWWMTGANQGGNKHATAADINKMLNSPDVIVPPAGG